MKLHLHFFVRQEWCSFFHGIKYLWFCTDEVLLVFKDHLFIFEILCLTSEESIRLESGGFLALASYSTVIVLYSGSLDAASSESVGPEKALAQAKFATALFKVNCLDKILRRASKMTVHKQEDWTT